MQQHNLLPLASAPQRVAALAVRVDLPFIHSGYSHGLEQLLVTSLQAGVDTSVIALWLEHAGVRSIDGYLHADITVKEKALAIPAEAQPGRYRLADKILTFLESRWPFRATNRRSPRTPSPDGLHRGILTVAA